MKSNKKIFICDACSWKKVFDSNKINLFKLKNDSMSNEKYRCPSCGRAVTSRPFKDPEQELQNKKKDDKLKEENENWIKENIEYQMKFRGIENGTSNNE